MGLFRREAPAPDPKVARKVAALVNAGDPDAASALCDQTANPRGTAFLAFRWIDLADEDSEAETGAYGWPIEPPSHPFTPAWPDEKPF